MNAAPETPTWRRPRLGFILSGMACASVIATFSLLVAAVVVH